MSRTDEYYAKQLAQTKLDAWTNEHAEELDGLSYTDERKLVTRTLERLSVEALAEVQANQVSEAARLTTSVLSSPLSGHVQAFFTDSIIRTQLLAERDAYIKTVTDEYNGRIPMPQKHVEAYNKGRLTLLLTRVEAAGLTICMGCEWAKAGVELCFIDGMGIDSVTDCMSRKAWFQAEARLTRLCPGCRSEQAHPPTAASAERTAGFVYSVSHAAEDRPDGTYAQFTGEWVQSGSWTWVESPAIWEKIPNNTKIRRTITRSNSISSRLAAAWNIPPGLRDNFDSQLIVDILHRFDDPVVITAP